MARFNAVVIFLCASFSLPLSAAIDAYPFPNEDLQARYESLIDELRCPQCLNTNLAGSDAMIAQDLRREVHRMLLDGYTDDEILSFMHERYGDFILYKPRVGMNTILLWMGPLLFLLVAAVVYLRMLVRTEPEGELSSDEQQQLSQLLQHQDQDQDKGRGTESGHN